MIKYFLMYLGVMFPTLRAEEITHFYDSSRSLGRGGTSVAAFDSDEASFLNPATMAETDIAYQLRLFQLDTFVSENTISTLSDIVQLASSGNFISFLKKMTHNFGERQYTKIQIIPLAQRYGHSEVSPFFINTTKLDMSIRDLPITEFTNDTIFGGNIAYSRQLFKSLSLGLNIRPFYQIHLPSKIEFVTLVNALSPGSSLQNMFQTYSGFYFALDGGIIWQINPSLRWGMTIRDIFDTKSSDKINLPVYKQTISTGILSRYELSKIFKMDMFFDYNDITNAQNVDLIRRLNIGAELGSSYFSRDNDFGITFGMNEGYFNFGYFLDLFILRIDIANYAVETGEYPGQQHDRRWSGSIRSTMTF